MPNTKPNARQVTYNSSYSGAVARTVDSKLGETVSVKDFGAVGDGVTSATSAFIAAAMSGAKHVLVPDGTYNITAEIVVAADDVHFDLSSGAVLNYSTSPTYRCFNWTGRRGRLSGGRLTGPLSWDGTNTSPTYAVVDIYGDDATVENVEFVNVRRVGIRFKDIKNGAALNNLIYGNYPSSQWTGVETVNYGVQLDPGNSAQSGNFIVSGNNVNGCVQGCFAGNYGSGDSVCGVVISGNNFSDCWNHGIYSTDGSGISVTGNTFNRCQTPIVVTGRGHVISGNTLYTRYAGTGSDPRDETGIQVRDAFECVVSNNTIIGNGLNNGTIINLSNTGANPISSNVISGNVINCSNGAAIGISLATQFTAVCSNNTISGNTIICKGRNQIGVIYVGSDAGYAYSNSITANNVQVLGGGHGIELFGQRNHTVSDNSITFQTNMTSATTVAGIYLNASGWGIVRNNKSFVPGGFGTNINLRGIWEINVSLPNYTANNILLTLGSLLSATNFVFDSTAGTISEEFGTGSPAHNSGVGSTWRRTDGSAGTTFYIKESGTTSVGWVGK